MSLSDTALVEVPAKDAFHIFTTEGAIEPLLAEIRKKIDDFVPDIETDQGRKDIASFAYRIAKSKTALDRVGKELTDEAKEIPKKIDAARKIARDTLDQWRDEVRSPLTNWEDAEKERIDYHVKQIEAIKVLGFTTDPHGNAYSSKELRENLKFAMKVEVGEGCEEFEDEYRLARNNSVEDLERTIVVADKAEADAAELERLRKKAVEREVKEAEEKALAVSAEIAARAAEAAVRAEREASAEREKVLQQEIIYADKKAAEKLAASLARDEAAAAARKANAEQRLLVDTTAIIDLTAGGLSKIHAALAVKLISENKITFVSINY